MAGGSGVLHEQLMAGAQSSDKSSGGAMQDINNIIYVPLNTMQYRFWDQSSGMKDELDGIELRLTAAADSIEVSKAARRRRELRPQPSRISR